MEFHAALVRAYKTNQMHQNKVKTRQFPLSQGLGSISQIAEFPASSTGSVKALLSLAQIAAVTK